MGQSHATDSGVRTSEDDQQPELEPEAAEPGTTLGVERLALVVDRSNRGGLSGGGHAVTVPPGAVRRRRRVAGQSATGGLAGAAAHPTIPAMDDPLAPFRWHPEPELIGIRDAATSRDALERAGEATWRASLDWLYDEAMVRAMGEPTGYAELRRDSTSASPAARPRRPRTPARSRTSSTSSGPGSPPTRSTATTRGRCRYFTPPPLVASIVGEVLAQWTNQGVDVWHAGPVGAFVEEEVVRWLCDLVGYGAGSFGLLHVGRRDGQLHRDGARPRRPPAAAGGPRPTAARRRPRGRPRLHQRPDALLDRAGARRAGLPARDAGRAPGRRPVPPPRRARRRGHRRATARPASAPSPSPPSPAPPTRARWISSRSWPPSRAREGLWFHVDAAYGGAARLSARDAGRVPGLDLADSVTIDPHKWFFQAYDIGALVVRDGTHLQQTFDRSPEYYRGGEGPGGGTPRGDAAHGCPRRPAQLLQARLRGHAAVPRAQAVDQLEAPRHAAAWVAWWR